jgi:hypothetical protein
MAGKDFLIMGRVKSNKKGKARIILTKKSFVQEWNSGLNKKIGNFRTKCGVPVLQTTSLTHSLSAANSKKESSTGQW